MHQLLNPFSEDHMGTGRKAGNAMTTAPQQQLLIGIGSPHGDDQIGWMIAEAIGAKGGANITVRRAPVPLDLLDWLNSAGSLHIVDACVGGNAVGELTRWEWPELVADHHDQTPFRSTHGFDLVSALRLGEKLGRLPSKVVVWGIEVGRISQTIRPTDQIMNCLNPISDRIFQELTDARKVAGAISAATG